MTLYRQLLVTMLALFATLFVAAYLGCATQDDQIAWWCERLERRRLAKEAR